MPEDDRWSRLAEVTARIDVCEMALAAEWLDDASRGRLAADLEQARAELAELERALGMRAPEPAE